MKYVEWNEPFDSKCKYNVVMRMKVDDVIAYQHESVKDKYNTYFQGYKSDEDALQDFVVIRWAKIVEYPE